MSKTKKVADAIEELCDLTDELIEALEKLVEYCNENERGNLGLLYEVIEAEKVLRKARGEE